MEGNYMIMNEREERNIILSFEKDILKSDISQEKLLQEISIFLNKKYISEENAVGLKSMLTMIHNMIPDNENSQYSNFTKKLSSN